MIRFGEKTDIRAKGTVQTPVLGFRKKAKQSCAEMVMTVEDHFPAFGFNTPSRVAYPLFEPNEKLDQNSKLSAYESVPGEIDFDFLHEIRMELEEKRISGVALEADEEKALAAIENIYNQALDKVEESDKELEDAEKTATFSKFLMHDILERNG